MIKCRPTFKNKKYTMLKDFDILAMTTEAEKELYEQANFQKGVQMMTPTYVRDEDGQKFSLFVSIEQFKQFGPGMYLLFLFLKYATIFFLFVSVFSFINTGILLEGGSLGSFENNFQINMAKSTLGNVQDNQLVVIIVFDYIMTVLILAAIIFWKERQATYVVECCKEIMLPSYQTVILKQIPELYTEFDMKVYLEERFGQVLDIYTVRNFNNDLYHYKEITKIAKEFKEQKALLRLKPQRGSIKLAKLFFDFQNYYFKMQRQSSLSKYPKQFAYISFKSVKSRQQMIKFYRNIFPRLDGQQRDYHLYKSDELKVKACLMEPNGIKWENLNLPKKDKFMWIMIQICLLILVLIISIVVIFILYVSQSSLSHTEFYGKSKEEIMAMDKIEALQSYCLGLSIPSFNSDTDCEQFSSQYVKYTILFVALPLIIALFKFILTEIMKALVNIRRHPYQIAKIQSQIIIMFVFYFFASGILQYIVFLEIKFSDSSSFSFVNIISPLQKALVGYLDIDTKKIEMTTDYNRKWYTIAAYKLILIALVSFNVSSFGKIAYSFLRKLACDFYARKQQLQCRMNYWLQGEQMQIQFVYAVAATVICFLLLFGSSFPLIYPFTCVSLFFLFWTTKYIFINFCAKPLLYSHSMNSLMVKIMLIGVTIHGFTAPLYFGASQIHSSDGIRNFLRIPHFGYYIVLMVVPLIYLFYRQKLGNLYERIKTFYEETGDKQQDFAPKRSKKMSLPSKLCLIEPQKNSNTHLMSYSMHENVEYECILKTLYTINKQERVRATCVLNKELQNLLQKDEAFAQGDDSNRPPKIFHELCKITEQNFAKFEKRVGKQYSKSNNPYKFYLKQLKQLERGSKISQTDPDIYAQIQSQGFMSNSLKSIDIEHLKQSLESNKDLNKSYLKKLEGLRKRYKPKANLKQIVERSDEQSISRYKNSSQDMDEAPNSEVRLRSTLNMGLVSNLGMVSNIGGIGGVGAVSNLGTMSRVRHRNSLTVANQEKLKEVYLLDDKFDCIKETQSMLDSIIYSKRYINEPPEKDKNSQYELKVTPPAKQFIQRSLTETEKGHPDSQGEVKRVRKSSNRSSEKHQNQKSKKEEIFKAYKKKKKHQKKLQDGFEPSQSSYDQESNQT